MKREIQREKQKYYLRDTDSNATKYMQVNGLSFRRGNGW
jgi:hypothetical protein